MYACMHACMYVWCMYVCMYMYECMYVCMFCTCLHTDCGWNIGDRLDWWLVHVYEHCTCKYVWVCVYIYINMCLYVCVHACTCACVCLHTPVYVDTTSNRRYKPNTCETSIDCLQAAPSLFPLPLQGCQECGCHAYPSAELHLPRCTQSNLSGLAGLTQRIPGSAG